MFRTMQEDGVRAHRLISTPTGPWAVGRVGDRYVAYANDDHANRVGTLAVEADTEAQVIEAAKADF